jgi:3-oxoacyl-[acyl-carrier protein] reductase
MSKRFEGKVAVVTGASKVSEIKKNGGKAVAVQADMAKKSDVGRLFDEAKKAFGRLDVLINNAGIYEFAPLDTISEENFHKQFDINVLGLIFASQEAAKYFGSEGGSIVNISSIASTLTPPNSAVYSGTKAAVDATTKVLAKELGPKKIRVNAVNPGMVDTEGWRAAGMGESELRKFVESQTPLGRIGKPDDIAPAVAFFASPDSSWITGETLTIAGGFR